MTDSGGASDGVGSSQQQQQSISAMRAAIDAKLREEGVYEQIRQLVRSKATPAPADTNTEVQEQPDEERLLQEVLDSEVVQQLLSAVKDTKLHRGAQAADQSTESEQHDDEDHDAQQNVIDAVNGRDVFLFLRLAGGKAFVDQLLEEEEEEEERDARGQPTLADSLEFQVGRVKTFFRVVATFQSQRLASKDVPCCVDPPFDEYFRFRVEKRKTRSSKPQLRKQSRHVPYDVEVVTPWEALCLVDEPVQLDLVKVSKQLVHWSHAGGPKWREVAKELLAVHRLDWRRVLCSTMQLVHLPVSLVGKMKVPVGSLDVRADLLHFKRTAAIAREAAIFLNKETLQRNTLHHAFYQYAKQWWHEYRNEASIYEAAQQSREECKLPSAATTRARLVKLFAEDDDGRFRMVCKFLTPVRAPAAIKSPSEAARFVGLLPFEATVVVGGARDETWRSIPAFLSLGRGDAQDHAVRKMALDALDLLRRVDDGPDGGGDGGGSCCSRRCCSAAAWTRSCALGRSRRRRVPRERATRGTERRGWRSATSGSSRGARAPGTLLSVRLFVGSAEWFCVVRVQRCGVLGVRDRRAL